ncbi:transposase (plasmid) [Arthrobacter sp. StoSoilB13]|nr:transposase [Arthrobacter sp. StoSoilB13]
MIRAYKFRMYPTSKQEALLRAMLADHRDLYNAALQERKEAWRRGKQVWFKDQDAQLTAIRSTDPDQARWSYSSQEQTLRRLDKAFKAFFRRIKSGEKKVGYPRFKGPRQFTSVEHRNGDGAKWASVPHPTQTRVKFQGVGHVKVKQHRPVIGSVKRLSAQREGKHWYVHLVVEQELPPPLPKTGAQIGLDLATGQNGLAYTSLGERIDNPRYGAAASEKIAAAQRQVFRCQQGSKRRLKAWDKVASLYRKARNQRHDYLHKTSRQLVVAFDLIVVEALRTGDMTRRSAPRPDGSGGYLPNGGTAKTGLNRSIRDAGWGQFLDLICAKAESAGRDFIQVNPAYTSQTCSACGHREQANRNGKVFLCVSCGHRDDADVNAALNILRAGLAPAGCGVTASRKARFLGEVTTLGKSPGRGSGHTRTGIWGPGAAASEIVPSEQAASHAPSTDPSTKEIPGLRFRFFPIGPDPALIFTVGRAKKNPARSSIILRTAGFSLVAPTGVDPVTFRFSVERSTN